MFQFALAKLFDFAQSILAKQLFIRIGMCLVQSWSGLNLKSAAERWSKDKVQEELGAIDSEVAGKRFELFRNYFINRRNYSASIKIDRKFDKHDFW